LIKKIQGGLKKLKKNNLFILSLVFLMVLSISVVTFAQEGPIKIGAVNPLGDITGRQATNAMKLAVKEINEAGGLLGREVKLVVVDSEFKPEKGAAAIDKLATVDEVDFFVGGMSSGVHLAQIPSLKKYQKITVWAGAASHKAEEAIGADADWYFHLHPWDYQQGASYGEGWTDIINRNDKIEVGKVFLAYEEGAFGTDSFKAYQSMAAMAEDGEGPFAEVMEEFAGASFKSAALGGGDYRGMLRQAKDYDPDLFIWAGYDADAVPMLAQSREVGFEPPLYVGAPPGWPADFGSNPLSDKVVLYGMWAPALKEVSDVADHFWNAYIELHNHEPATYFAPLGYTNIMYLAEGIKKAKTLEKEVLIEALRDVEYVSPLGSTLRMAPSNIIKNQGFTRQKILQYQDGEQHVIWPFEFATSEIEYPFSW
ncbi:MAG: ABC transporter substrate-binding protein, partial [Halanaerobiales bacterium]|nr:ABC transporter substrate-binding protein [Halanaerobiales bacterium]